MTRKITQATLRVVLILFLTAFIIATSYLSALEPSQSVHRKEHVLRTEWRAFSCKNSSLVEFSPTEIAVIANEWGIKMMVLLEAPGTVREIDPVAVEKLMALLEEDEAKIFMRHGEQARMGEVHQLSIELEKIEMMRLPDNFESSLTKASIAELMEGMIVWEYLRQKTNRSFIIESSKNKRATLPAYALAYALKTDVNFRENLNCVNYPSEDKMSTLEILKWLPDGTLPWEKQKVDAVVGLGVYEYINDEMEKLLFVHNQHNNVSITITHTQQMNSIAILSGLPATRLGNFGFIALTDKHKEVFSNGFYKKN